MVTGKSKQQDDFQYSFIVQTEYELVDNRKGVTSDLPEYIVHGDNIMVKANLGGRKSLKDGKESFFNSVSAWYIKVENEAAQPSAATQLQPYPKKGDGNLPF